MTQHTIPSMARVRMLGEVFQHTAFKLYDGKLASEDVQRSPKR